MSGIEHVRKSKPILCTVTSDKCAKSRVGRYVRLVKHPVYQKYIKRTSSVMFHDEKNESALGDKVLVEASRPMSKRKRFTLTKVVEKNNKIGFTEADSEI